MKFSYQWLTTLVDIGDLSPAQLKTIFDQAGIEVEAVEPLVKATKITTGYVEKQSLIPGSDHLSVVLVDTGHHGKRTIVCGAPNIRAGQKVLVALPGAILPGGTIQASIIKGVPSEGMICALNELGLAEKFLSPSQVEGIEVLPDPTPIGDDFILDHLGLTDTIITLKLLANRPDLWSLQGLAYEVAALTNRPLKLPHALPENTLPTMDFKLHLQSEKTKQFSVRILKGVKTIVTPPWLKQRLIASGIRPISFLVDIGNYIMLLTGQPLHMYDFKKLPQPALTLSESGYANFLALDGKKYPLQSGDIVIASGQQVMCLAGVMGAQICAVDDQTLDVVIEAAAFDSTAIRKTAQRLNLISDASLRFSKGVDLSHPHEVLTLTTQLMQSLTSIETIYQTISASRPAVGVHTIRYQPQQINRLLGTTYDGDTLADVLSRFAIRIEKQERDYLATIPSHRRDLQEVADLAEEVVRIKGFADLSQDAMPAPLQPGGLTEFQEKIRLTKEYFKGQGFDATLTYTLVDQTWKDAFSLLFKKEGLTLQNPLSEERKHVRTNVLGSLIQVVQYNQARQMNSGRLFEIAQLSFHHNHFEELAMVSFGEFSLRANLQPQKTDFYFLKGVVEGWLHLLRIEPTRYQWRVFDEKPELLHPGRSASLWIQNQCLAIVGELSPLAIQQFDLGQFPIIVGQVDLRKILELKTSPLKFKPIPRFPVVTRDLAMIVPKHISYQHLLKTIYKAGKKLVDDVQLFDLYQGTRLEDGQLSIALRLYLLSEEKTLQEEEITQTIQAIKEALIHDHQVILRS